MKIFIWHFRLGALSETISVYHFLCLLFSFFSVYEFFREDNREVVKLGYLPSNKKFRPRQKGYAPNINGALIYAIEEVNSCSCKFKLVYEVKDATRNPINATKVTLDLLYKKEVAVFIGPEGPSCSTVATMAAAENKAMISYG